MDKKRLEIIVTAILVLVFILAWANTFSRIKKRAGQKPAVPVSIEQEARALSPAVAPAIKQDALNNQGSDWGRDPFSGRIYKAVKEEAQKDLRVAGILWSKKKPTAIINNKICEIGSRVGGCVVVDIKEDRVILDDGTRAFELKLGQ